MTTFKQVTNRETLNTRYFIDGIRVSEQEYQFRDLACSLKGLQYNSSVLWFKDHLMYNQHCYD